jgi:hypothetical protein
MDIETEFDKFPQAVEYGREIERENKIAPSKPWIIIIWLSLGVFVGVLLGVRI